MAINPNLEALIAGTVVPNGGDPDTIELEDGRQHRWQRLSDVETKPIEWLIEPYLPRGMVAILAGRQGLGKSWLTAAFAAMITRGFGPSWFSSREPGRVVFICKEDSFSYVMKPRLEKLEANCNNIIGLDCETGARMMLDPNGIKEIREIVGDFRPDLFVIDPIMSMINGRVNTKDQNAVREVIGALPAIGQEFGCTFTPVAHLNKTNDPEPMNRVMASVDFVALPRSVLFVGCDPDDHSTTAMAHIKSNVGPIGQPLGYQVDKTGMFTWSGFSDLTGDRMCEQPAKKIRREDGSLSAKEESCRTWLLKWLEPGPAQYHQTILRGHEAGFSKTMLNEIAARESVSHGYQPTNKGHRGPAWWGRPGFDFSKFQFPQDGGVNEPA